MPRQVVLVNPNRIRPPIAPLAIEYLAHALDAARMPWALADLCFAEDPETALQDALDGAGPLLVAITFRNTDDCYCATQHSFVPDLQQLVGSLRALTGAPIVVGGAGFSVAPQGIMDRTGADFGIVGDGEGPLVRLAQALESGADVAGIPGLLWRATDAVHAAPPAWQDVTQEPLPRTVLDNERYFREGGQLGIETKRGCPMRCAYCADLHSKGPSVRTRAPGAVAQEMLGLASRGLDVFHTCDSEFNSDPMHAMAVCEQLAAHQPSATLRWYAYCSPTPFPRELARLMREAGCVGVNFGTDSGDARMLRRLGRDHTPEDVRACVRACHDEGLVVMLDLLLGASGETPDSLAQSIRLAREVEADCVGIALGARLYAGTALTRSLQTEIERGASGLRGEIAGNAELALPLFYLEPALGEDPVGLVRDLVGSDQRFFFGWPDDTQADYNYDDNPELVQAIAGGRRGAYWDILRRRGSWGREDGSAG
ncbi:MAG: radical SAM protein [Armatimonadetes bacterium]|nr:radical SAM protein [Armatimonadota bacterium]